MSDINRDPITGIRPIGDRILVKQEEWKDKIGSLYIPQGHREGYVDVGVVRAVGRKVTIDVKPGDRVTFKRQPASALLRYTGESGPGDWKDLLILKEENVSTVISDDQPSFTTSSNSSPP